MSNDILDEVADTLTTHERMRHRYRYPDEAIVEYRRELARLAAIVGGIPEIRAVRDPDDDKILACAIATGADYLVTRDKDLLSLDRYWEIAILSPERLLHLLRGRP